MFEDDFIAAQSSLVSSCAELANNEVDIIYIFVYQDEEMLTFNAFFKKNDKIKTLSDFVSKTVINQFFNLGIEDILNLLAVCNKYQQKCPNEIKMIYNMQSNTFDAKYGYQNYSILNQKDPNDVFF